LISELAGAVPVISNASEYTKDIVESATLRRVINTCRQSAIAAQNKPDDINLFLDDVEQQIYDISDKGRTANKVCSVQSLTDSTIKNIELALDDMDVRGIQTGYPDLDKIIGGMKPANMIVLAARPSLGKTALALNIAYNASGKGKRVMFFSLEMSKDELMGRLYCMSGEINMQSVYEGFIKKDDLRGLLTKATKEILKRDMYIDDSSTLSKLDIRSKARQQANKTGIDLIVVDYLQLMATKERDSREVEVSSISRALKATAKDMNVPVLALAQLNRQGAEGKPRLSQLRESGAIEQDADVVLLMSHAEDESGNAIKDTINVEVAKQRNGRIGEAHLYFDKPIQRFRSCVHSSDEAKIYTADDGGYENDEPF
jgi:replicative DNA helicase